MRSDASTQRGIICPEEDAMPQPDGHHARLVYSVIRGASPDAAAPEHVRRSWQRCLDEYGLDPESKAQPVLVSHQEPLVRKEQNLELVSLADAEMAHLCVHRVGDPLLVRDHSRAELVRTWSEGLIAREPADAVAPADRNALFQLAYKKEDELIGGPLERMFNISLAALLGRSGRKSFHPL